MSSIVQKSFLFGTYFVPPSKSQTIRALLFATLAKGKSTIKNPLFSTDTYAMIEACKTLGASFSIQDNQIDVQGIDLIKSSVPKFIDCKNSGLILRFLPAICALTKDPLLITGDYSIQTKRVLDPLLDGLSQLGAACFSLKKQGFAPAYIKGPISPGTVIVDGKDSQPISALLIALSLLDGRSDLIVKHPGEVDWVNLTLDWLDRFSLKYTRHSSFHYSLYGKGKIKPFTYQVCGDFSAAFYPIAAALITNSELQISHLDFSEKQPDKAFITLVEKMGAKISLSSTTLTVHKDSQLKGAILDVGPCIDAISILAVIACFAEGKTILTNAAIARKKECDRLSCITKELKKMHANIEELEDGLIIEKSNICSAKVTSYEDHRMVFSLTCAALGAEGKTEIENTLCIRKTNPWFFEKMKEIGADLCTFS